MNRLRLLIATVLLLALSLFALSIGDCRGTFVCHVSNNSFSYFWPPVQGPCFIIGMWAWYAFRSHLTGASSVTRRTAWLFFSLASVFALATAALGVWLAKAHELAPIFAACSAVAFLLFVCSRRHDARGGEPRGTLIRRCADALGRESYGIYLWHFVCVYATLHFFEGVFGQSDRKTSLVLFIATVLAVLAASYAFSRVSDRMIQGRATRLSRSILAHVDRRFHGGGRV
jgi:peptidoglycan/LPS O-acetylase OafA/YrhL